MLAKRIIPTLLCKGNQLVKGTNFNAWRTVGVAVQAIQIQAERGVDEIMLLDVAATPEQRLIDVEMVRRITDRAFTPIAVGGGIRTVHDVQTLLANGADKVVIGTAAMIPTPQPILKRIASIVGSQALVVSLDYTSRVGGQYRVYSACGVEDCGLHDLGEMAKSLEGNGAGEILLQAIDREGMQTGLDLDAIYKVSRAVDVPVIASGGCNSYQDMLAAFEAGASAVGVGALFQFNDATPKEAATWLHEHGVEVRL